MPTRECNPGTRISKSPLASFAQSHHCENGRTTLYRENKTTSCHAEQESYMTLCRVNNLRKIFHLTKYTFSGRRKAGYERDNRIYSQPHPADTFIRSLNTEKMDMFNLSSCVFDSICSEKGQDTTFWSLSDRNGEERENPFQPQVKNYLKLSNVTKRRPFSLKNVFLDSTSGEVNTYKSLSAVRTLQPCRVIGTTKLNLSLHKL